MPTNILRKSSTPRAAATRPQAKTVTGMVEIAIGRVTLRARLCQTATAHRLWAALPLFSHAETWGASVHFELPVECGRERGARINATPGEIYYWSEDDRIIIPFGPTPISRPNEIRLPRPCNVLAVTTDDVAALSVITPSEKVSIRRLEERPNSA